MRGHISFNKAQILITRKCNLSCQYCKISKKNMKELSLNEWKEAILILDNLGIKFIKIMGGEPTLKQDLEDLIRFIKTNTKIKVALFTNSVLTCKRIDSLMDSKIDQYITSIDTINAVHSFNKDNAIKSGQGLKALLYLVKKGFTDLRANIVVGKNNIQDIPRIVKYLSEKGIYSSLTPVHVGKEKFWQYRCPSSNLQLRPCDKKEVDKTFDELLRMKKEGALIANSEQFIIDWSKYAIGTSWRCRVPPVLWIDSDGKMMCCNDIRGRTSSLSIFNLKDKVKYKRFIELIKKDAKKCPGCFYNCQYDGKIFV